MVTGWLIRGVCVLRSVHQVILVPLDVPVQPGVLGHPPHLRQDEAAGEVVPAQRAVALRCQHAVQEVQTEAEAVVVVLVEAEIQTDRRWLDGLSGDTGEAGEAGEAGGSYLCQAGSHMGPLEKRSRYWSH